MTLNQTFIVGNFTNLPARAFISVQFTVAIYMTTMLIDATARTINPLFTLQNFQLMLAETPFLENL